MRHRPLLIGFFAAATALVPRQTQAGPVEAPLESFTLDNGLRVAVSRLPSPVVAVQVWYHVGAKDEPRDRRGSAHMFEHLMFRGSERVRPEDHARFVNRVGGQVNAATTEDATYYKNVLPAAYLDFAIQLEAERMRNLLFRDDVIATEREVVKEEIRQQENNPLAKGLLRFLAVAFQQHPYAWTAGGTIGDLDATTAGDLKRFYDTYYVPENALLVVVGDVTAEQVKRSAQAHFGAIAAKGGAPPRPADKTPEPPQLEKRREVVEPGQIGLALVGFKIPAAMAPDTYALQVLALVLGNGESSRLVRRIKTVDAKAGRPLGVAAGTPILVREHPGLFLAFAVYLDAASSDAAEAALLDEVRQVGRAGITAEELGKAKNQIRAAFVFGLEGAQGLAEQIGQSWILTGDPGQFLRDLAEIEKITRADVQRVANQYLDPERATIVIVPPSRQ